MSFDDIFIYSQVYYIYIYMSYLATCFRGIFFLHMDITLNYVVLGEYGH